MVLRERKASRTIGHRKFLVLNRRSESLSSLAEVIVLNINTEDISGSDLNCIMIKGC